MGILGPHSLQLKSPSCDWLDVTVPLEESFVLREEVTLLAAELGGEEVSPGKWAVPALRLDPDLGAVVWYSGKPGILALQDRGAVLRVSASGTVCESLRSADMFVRYLHLVGQFPHRITRLDACVDVLEPGPPVVQALRSHVFDERQSVRLGRKAVPPARCSEFMGLSVRGEHTGTVYLGKRGNSDITARVYDKRHEREAKGFSAPGPWWRCELTFASGVGCTLRDAASPGGVFWAYSGDLLDSPAEFDSWDAFGEGYVLEPPAPLDPILRFRRACERSLGLQALVHLADRLKISRAHAWGTMRAVCPDPRGSKCH